MATLILVTLTGLRASYAGDTSSLVTLGHRLFFDKRLSFNKTKSCASCHDPTMAFTDGYRRSLGASGDLHMRNSSSLLNIAERPYFTAADSTLRSLRDQIKRPLFNTQFIELGVTGHETRILADLNQDPDYRALLATGKHTALTFDLILDALTTYCSTLVSRRSRYDRGALSGEEQRGRDLFFSQRFGCGGCHNGRDLDTPTDDQGDPFRSNGFFHREVSHVTTLFPEDKGLALVTKRDEDIGRFRVPSLRNVAITAPYMHDGSVATLSEVLDSYATQLARRERTPSEVSSPAMTDEERRALLSFLDALTDTSYLDHPLFLAPPLSHIQRLVQIERSSLHVTLNGIPSY